MSLRNWDLMGNCLNQRLDQTVPIFMGDNKSRFVNHNTLGALCQTFVVKSSS